jgi:dihydrofolate synthase / folylpolyglutamate synthase
MTKAAPPFADLSSWLSWQEQHHPKAIDMGLARVSAVARRLGLLTPNARVITVGGTNGKGSAVAALDALLRHQGYRVGAYTSPHLLTYNERVRLGGAPVSDEQLVAAFNRIQAAAAEISLTYFEYGTLAALLIFQEACLDFWVLEVGLGGRLDAVNILDCDCALITSIALDHQEYLGDTREAIGREKLGIARAGKPLVVAETDLPADFDAFAQTLGAEVSWCGRQWQLQGSQLVLSNGRRLALASLSLPLPSIAGALEVLVQMQLLPDAIDLDPLLAGLRLPGRFYPVTCRDSLLWVDVAHNPAGAEWLAAQLQARFPEKLPLLMASMADKDIPSMVKALSPVVAEVHCCGLPGNARAAEADTLAAYWRAELGEGARVQVWPSVQAALSVLTQSAAKLVVTGSFFTVAEAISYSANADTQAQ